MMTKTKRAAIVVALAVGIAGLTAASPRGRYFVREVIENQRCCELPLPRAIAVAWQVVMQKVEYPSQIGQDKWVAEAMFPGVTDGYFLDIGSGHGRIGSNTLALEARGWKGICVDPFPTAMEGRTCQMMKEVVFSEAGKVVQFHPHEGLGGIADTLGRWKDQAKEAPPVELITVTTGELLERGHAPPFIHFLSLDIEGAELEALRSIPFDKYRFGAMAIEHNDEEPKRTDIIKFLEERGYRRVHSYKQDDFFAPVTP